MFFSGNVLLRIFALEFFYIYIFYIKQTFLIEECLLNIIYIYKDCFIYI